MSYGTHDALEDVKALGSLTDYACDSLSTGDIMDFPFSPKCVFHAQQFNEANAQNIQSLNELVVRGVCKRFVAEKIAGSGLNIHHLRHIFWPVRVKMGLEIHLLLRIVKDSQIW